jgi:VIT1/CCC1 family predicted Fe2+/Mn2+ transporter
MKPAKYLKGVTFDFEKDSKAPLGPHLAYTLAEQGGAASGHNKALLFKARGTDITEELLKALSDAGITLEEVEVETKEESNNDNDLRKSFEDILSKKYKYKQ